MKTAGAGWIRLIEPVKRETGASPVQLVTVSREYQKRKKSLDNGKTRF